MEGDIPPDDGFKWFGEGFEGFPKRLPDDCVEYLIYVIDERLRDLSATRTRLNQVLKVAKETAKKHTKDYIWQRDAFELKLQPNLASQDPSQLSKFNATTPHLKGRSNFGDSIADEWLIVYLLLELSRQCPDAWIRVYDTDGEFLLIEAANALPKWLNPDIAENRVWLNNGHLRIIPLDEDGQTAPGNLELQDALDFIRRTPDKFIISPFIEDEAFYRLRSYPSAIQESMHHAMVKIPRRLAYILQHDPAYISAAVEAFYLRDPIALKPLATKDLSTLTLAPEDFVTVSAKFTKVGYAQLKSQVFDPPPAWTGVAPRLLREPELEMGMKMTSGFEMLLADQQNQDKKAVREMKMLLEDLETGEETLPTDQEIATWEKKSDDEKWLDIDYNDFEKELSGKGKGAGKSGQGFGDQGAQENLRKMVSRFEDFLNDDAAGAEGVDDDDIDDDDDDDGSTSGSDDGEDKNASFDEAEFERAMKEMMGMPPEQVEKSGLLEEARKLALEDEEEGEAPDEDEEMKKVIEMMEKELKGHGALNLNERGASGQDGTANGGEKKKGDAKPTFGPPRPPASGDTKDGALTKTSKGKGKAVQFQDDTGDVDEEFPIGPGDAELSSDDEDYNDVDLGLAKNMLEAFKGQAGTAGPAGNLMKSLGVNMPRDEEGMEKR
ncbi:SGT1-domain-containing protein [Hortaea werneckii]|nr:SGT1-domain-containing protein [Hortaea werneckii]